MIRHITNLYPKKNNPQYGIFIKEQLDALKEDIELDALILKSTFPAFTENWKVYADEILTNQNDTFDVKELNVFDFPKQVGLRFTLKLLESNLQKLDWEQVELVHIHYLYPGILVTPFLIKNKIPYLIHVHGSDWEQFRAIPRLKSLINKGLNQAKKIIFAGKENFDKGLAIYPAKSVYLPNGIDFSSIETEEEKLNNPDEKTVICVANVIPLKGLNRLSVLAKIQLKYSWKIEVYGKIIDKKIVKELEDVFKNSKHSIHFFGAKPKSDIYEALKKATIFIQTSYRESFGIAVIEAMFSKLPIIASNTGIIQQAESNSALLKTDFTESDLLKNFLDHHEEILSHDLGLNVDFASKFSMEVYKKALLNLYKGTIK